MNRRSLLAAMLAATTFAARAQRTPAPAHAGAPRIVTLDWGLTEMALSLGVIPVGVANPHDFLHTFTVCRLPASVVDVGLIFQPNLELLLALKPDWIVITPAHARLRASLERIAPTFTLGRYPYTRTPYVSACKEMRDMAERFGRMPEADAVIARSDAAIAQARRALAAQPALTGTPLLMTRFMDEAHVRVAGATSLYGEMMAALGLRNAWTQAGAFATTGIASLGDYPQANLAYLRPLPAFAVDMMKHSPLWRALPFSRLGRMFGLPLVPPNGGVQSAAYFAGALAQALLDQAAASRRAA